MQQLFFYVPESHKEEVKQAIFAVGGGQIGNYQCCSWEVKGQGQFMPVEGSDPFIGEQNTLTQVDEYRVEIVFKAELRNSVINALKKAHPYEEPAFGVVDIKSSR